MPLPERIRTKSSRGTLIGYATLLLSVFCPNVLWAQSTFENPQPNSFQSGIGVISGFVCTAVVIEIEFDGIATFEAAYGTSRGDTQDVCGDTDNGFSLLFNWNLLDDGLHTVRALADGVEFASVTVTVTTFGVEFLTGVSGEFTLPDFPEDDTDVTIRWQQGLQNFVISSGAGGGGGSSGVPPRVLENPQPGSFQSGIGVISGFVCDTFLVEIEFDGVATFEAAYGTSRGDTQGLCGDADNGFSLLFNWNLLDDGLHTVRALADGVEFASVTVTVTTFGVEFLTGVSGEFTLPDFPEAGTEVIIRWQQPLQNFVIIERSSPSSSVPDVAGTWNVDLSFVSENCLFLSPNDLPRSGRDTFQLMQTGGTLSGEQGGEVLSGTTAEGALDVSGSVEPNGDFVLTSESLSVSGGGCRATVFVECMGNFLAGNTECAAITRVSGSCPPELNSCEAVYRGTITKAKVSLAESLPHDPAAFPIFETVTDTLVEQLGHE